MTDCTERHLAWVDDGRDREGHEGMTEGSMVMTDCTERRLAWVDDGRDHEGTTKGSRA
jgi:hypothetical protein